MAKEWVNVDQTRQPTKKRNGQRAHRRRWTRHLVIPQSASSAKSQAPSPSPGTFESRERPERSLYWSAKTATRASLASVSKATAACGKERSIVFRQLPTFAASPSRNFKCNNPIFFVSMDMEPLTQSRTVFSPCAVHRRAAKALNKSVIFDAFKAWLAVNHSGIFFPLNVSSEVNNINVTGRQLMHPEANVRLWFVEPYFRAIKHFCDVQNLVMRRG